MCYPDNLTYVHILFCYVYILYTTDNDVHCILIHYIHIIHALYTSRITKHNTYII